MEHAGFTSISPSVELVSSSTVSLLAHQGGWDEILLVAGPIAVILVLLAIVNRRIDARLRQDSDGSASHDSSAVDRDALDGGADPA